MPVPVKVRVPRPASPAVAPLPDTRRQPTAMDPGPADVVRARTLVGNAAITAAMDGLPAGSDPNPAGWRGQMLLAGQNLVGNQAVATQAVAPAVHPVGKPPARPQALTKATAPPTPKPDQKDSAPKERQDKGATKKEPAGPRSPGTDPKFQALKKDVTAKKRAIGGSHPPATAEAGAAQSASVPPADDREARGKAAHAEDMDAAQPKEFSKSEFVAAVQDAIAKRAPKNLDEADKFGDSGKADEVKAEVQGKVGEGKEASAKEIADTTAAPPQPAPDTKEVVPLAPDKVPGKPGTPNPDQAVPDPLPASATDMSAGPAQVDQQMADAQVTEPQLTKSNEPTFTKAVKDKKTMEAHSATAPAHLRAGEAHELKQVKNVAATKGTTAMAGLHATRVATGQQVGKGKASTKTSDEDKRTQVTALLQKVFDQTKCDVEKILSDLDKKVDDQFTTEEKRARDRFTAEHTEGMNRYKHERYSGFWGKARWVKDLFADLPEEANRIYERAKDNYLTAMRQVIANIADTIDRELRHAKDRIAAGRKELTDAVDKLPADLRALGREAATDFESKFDELKDTVNDKGTELVDTLATKYTDAVKSVDDEIAAEKEKNKGLVSKAADAIAGIIRTIKELGSLLMGVLRKAVSAIGAILSDPIGFLGNLVTGVGGGLKLFMKNAGRHLEQGVLAWLLGTAATAGIQLPTSFDILGILLMITTLLGLSWANLRARLVRKVPEKAVAAAETAVPLVMEVKKRGVAGMWADLKTRVGDLKKDLISNLVSFLLPTIIIAGITWIVSLFNPASAFIRACKMIIDIIRFIVTNGRQIIEFVNTVLDAVIAIAKGGTGGVPALVERALAKSIPVLIGALAALLGIGGIAGKIKEVFQKLARPVNRAIDWVIDKIVGLVKKLWAKLKAALDKKKRAKPGKRPDRRRDKRSESKKQNALSAAVRDATRLLNDESATVDSVRRGLPAIKRRRRLAWIRLEREPGGRYFVELEVNPKGRTPARPIGELAAATRTATGEVDPKALEKLMASLPYVPREDEAMRRFAARSVNATGEVSLVDIAGGGAHGVSGAPVSLIAVPDPAAGPGGQKVIAALKVFPKASEFAMEVSALVRLGKIRITGGRAVSVHGVARTSTAKTPGGMLVTSAAPGQEVARSMEDAARTADGPERRKLFAEALEGVEATGRTLAGLHKATGASRKPSSPYMARFINSMRDILSNLEPVRELIAEFGVDLGSLRARAEQLIAGFEANPGGSAIVHGDAHPGNFFYQRGSGVTMIDTPTVHFSMDAGGRATGSPSRDVSYFLQKLAGFGRSYDLRPDEVAALQSAFRRGYAAGGGPKLSQEADEFFRARTVIGEFIGIAKGVEAARAPGSDVTPEKRQARERALRIKAQLTREAFGVG